MKLTRGPQRIQQSGSGLVYERVRSQLASDKAVSAEDLERIAEAARAASSAHSGAKGLEELSTAAEAAASKASQGVEKAREGFREVSRSLIAFIGESPELARGRYVFECPMAKATGNGCRIQIGSESLHGAANAYLRNGERVAPVTRPTEP